MKRCLVTGASGFVGRVLCRELRERGVQVRALLLEPGPGPWEEGVVHDLAAGPVPPGHLEGVDTVFHLAGMAHVPRPTARQEALCRRINVEATEALARAAASAGVGRFVFMSSVKAAGRPGEECLDEGAAGGTPTDLYGITKLEAEQRLHRIAEASGMPAAVLRPALVYGPGVKGNLAALVRGAAAGWLPPLPRVENRRSMVGVEDLARAAIQSATTGGDGSRLFYVTDGEQYSTADLWDAVASAAGRRPRRWCLPLGLFRAAARTGDRLGDLLGRRLPFDSNTLESLFGSACYSSERLRREVGWRPSVTFWDAVPGMVAQLEGGR